MSVGSTPPTIQWFSGAPLSPASAACAVDAFSVDFLTPYLQCVGVLGCVDVLGLAEVNGQVSLGKAEG